MPALGPLSRPRGSGPRSTHSPAQSPYHTRTTYRIAVHQLRLQLRPLVMNVGISSHLRRTILFTLEETSADSCKDGVADDGLLVWSDGVTDEPDIGCLIEDRASVCCVAGSGNRGARWCMYFRLPFQLEPISWESVYGKGKEEKADER